MPAAQRLIDPSVFDHSMSATEQRLTTQSIRSFVLRQGRMSPAQHHAYDTLLPRYGIGFTPQPLDASAAFGRAAPLVLEIGSGMGETTAHIAQAMPQNNFVAVEVHTPGVGALLKLIEQHQLTNLRVIQHDAVEVVQHMIAEKSLAGVHLFFPDPWPKARHHKRRIVQPGFIKLLASRLAPGGYLHCATDWESYARWMLEVLSSEPSLINAAPGPATGHTGGLTAGLTTGLTTGLTGGLTTGLTTGLTAGLTTGHAAIPTNLHLSGASGFAPRPAYRPITKFETRGLKLGHGVWDLLFHTSP